MLELLANMCGICGLTGYGLSGVGQETIRAMTAALAHRGPDAQEVWLDAQGRCALGHARLSIVDLETGSQPMHSADGRYTIVFNGEIYNFHALRKTLEQRGHVFRTHSDTEVLLEAYSEWGVDALSRFDGMFAFAIFDNEEGSLLVARDRVGIKPFYYHWNNGRFAFASEIKSLFKVPGMPRCLDYRALADYLTLGYPMAPTTFFSDVRELRPGHWLKLCGDKLREDCYWSWRREEQDWSEEESLAKAKDVLMTTLEEHMIADVPIGALLSGGIDSSLLVSLLAKELGVRVETFTVSFGDRDYDESAYAAVVAKHFQLVHHKVTLPKASISNLDEIHAVLDQFDQPFVDSSAIPTYLLCRELRKYVKVAIGGDGGDETFGGYSRFYYADLACRIGQWPAPMLAVAESLRGPISCMVPGLTRQVGKILRAARDKGQQRLFDLFAYNDPLGFSKFLTKDAARRIDGYTPMLSFDGPIRELSDGRDMIDLTMNVTLPCDYLRKIDVMSMAHGLEVRVPFLGARVLNLAAQIPHCLKHPERKQGKTLLRKMLRQYLPAEITARGKSGFGIPLDTTLSAEKRKAIEEMLTGPDAHIRPLIDVDYTRRISHEFVTGKWAESQSSRFGIYQQVYMLWSLERWLQTWAPTI